MCCGAQETALAQSKVLFSTKLSTLIPILRLYSFDGCLFQLCTRPVSEAGGYTSEEDYLRPFWLSLSLVREHIC